MDDSSIARLFARPFGSEQRRYEILRAVFYERLPQREVALRFGVSYENVRRIASDFRKELRRGDPPFSLTQEDGRAFRPTKPTH